jgi:hypothetical protein
MYKAVGPALLVALGLLAANPAAEAPFPPGAPEPVERLIGQLGDRSPAVREKATQALEAMGAGIAPALRRAQDHTDPEVRRQAALLLAGVEKGHLIQPRRVSIQLQQRPIREAVTELAKQSGYTIELYPAPANNDERDKQLHSFQIDNVPFWEAVERISREGGLTLQRTWRGEDGRLQLRFADEYVPFVSNSGSFRLVAQGFQYHRSIEFATLARNAPVPGQRSEQLTFRFVVISEPRLPILWMGRPIVTEAVDENNNSLLLPETAAETERISYHDRGYFYDAWINLARVGRDAQTVKRLRGIVPVRLLVEQTPELVVDKVLQAKGQKLKSAATELDIEEVKEQADAGRVRYDVKFAVRNLRGEGGLEYNFYASIRYRVELHDAKGAKYAWGGGGWGGNENSVRGTFTFHHPGGEIGPPAKLIFHGWNTLYHRVPFEFRDLPLP